MHRDNSKDKKITKLQALIDLFDKGVSDNMGFWEVESFEEVIDYYKDKNELNKALQVVEVAGNQHPNSSRLLIKEAEIKFEMELFEEVIQLVEKARIFDPSDPDAYILQSEVYLLQKQHKKALKVLNNALVFADKELKQDLWHEIADVYEDMEKYEYAYKVMKKILIIDSGNTEALERIWLYAELAEVEEDSIRFHKKLIDNDPYAYLAWYNLAHGYNSLGLYEKAAEAYEYVITINEKCEYAYLDCAEIYIKLKHYLKAVYYYEEALRIFKPGEFLYYQIGFCYEKLKQTNLAKKNYKKALDMNPDYEEANYRMARLCIRHHEWQTAINHLEKGLALNPGTPVYLLMLAQAYERIGNVDKCIELLQEYTDKNPQQKKGWLLLAKTLFDYDEKKEAIEVLEEAVRHISGYADLYYYKSAFLFSIGKRNKAKEVLAEGLCLNHKRYYILYNAVPGLKADNEISDLIKLYKKL